MLIEPGEKVHVITRRGFVEDLRRHFVGIVTNVNDFGIRLEGTVFVFDLAKNQYTKRPGKRVRIIGFLDSGHIINIIPKNVILEELEYRLNHEKHLVVTDGKNFSLDINEFGVMR